MQHCGDHHFSVYFFHFLTSSDIKTPSSLFLFLSYFSFIPLFFLFVVYRNGFLRSIDKALINVGDTLEAVAESIVNYGENVVNLVR